jgi:Cellulose biosynthesis protein BcsS
MLRGAFLSAVSLAVLASAAARADIFPVSDADKSAKSVVLFAGGSVREDADYAIVGAVAALNGDLGKNGIIFNGSWEFLKYEYLATPVTPVEADGFGFNALVGYQWVWGDGDKFAALAGLNHRHIDTAPFDPLSDSDGDNTSFKVQGELYLNNPGWDLSALGSYQSHQNAWYGRVRPAIKLGGGVDIGPEIAYHGSDEYDTLEYGAFIRMPLDETTTVGVRAGYADSDDSRSDGGYVGVEIATAF